MQFIQVSSDWIYSKTLNRIENRYGLAGIGFYWKVISAIFRAGQPLPEVNLLAMRGKGLRWEEARQIIHLTKEIFTINGLGLYQLIDDTESSGIIIPENQNAEIKRIFSSRARTEAGTQAGTEAGTEASAEAGTDTRTEAGTQVGTQTGTEAGTDTGTEAGSAQVLVDSLEENIIEKKREEERLAAEQEAEDSFLFFMENDCPHLLNFEEPMTFDELKELRTSYSVDDIRKVLIDMNDKPGLEETSRSCFMTAKRWLEARERKRR